MTIQNIATKKIIQNYPKEKFETLDNKTKSLYKVISDNDSKEIPVTNSLEKNTGEEIKVENTNNETNKTK